MTLSNALNDALTREPGRPDDPAAVPRDQILLQALRNSATDRDQIVLRRIGTAPEPTPQSS